MRFEPVEGQNYRIVAKHSGKVAEVRDGAVHRGLPIQQGVWKSEDHQQFQFHREGQYYNIVSRKTGRSFDVAGDSWLDDAAVVQWDRHDYSANQQFILLPAGDGHYYISARHSQKFICVSGGSQDAGKEIVQHGWSGGDHYKFSFEPCEPIVSARALREIVLRGADPIRDAVLSLVKLIPTAGGGVSFLLGLFWKDSGGSLVEQVRDYVRTVARQMIDEEFLNNLAKEMDGIKNVIEQYSLASYGGDKGGWMTSVIQKLEGSQPNFFDMRAPEKTLPHLLTLGSMHLSALRERYDDFEKLYGKKPDNPEDLLKNLQARVALYVQGGQTARAKTLEWRLSQITLSQHVVYEQGHPHHDVFIVEDKYDGFRYVADFGQIDASRAAGQTVFDDRKRHVMDSFNAELDALFGPALVWKYLNPAETGKQKTVRVTTKSELFGARRGTEFDGGAAASYDTPIAEVKIAVSSDGTRINGLAFRRGQGGALTTYGELRDDVKTYTLAPGEFISAAYGTHGGPFDSLFSLYLVTNRNLIVGGGRRDFGTAWGSEPPIGAAPRLDTFFGWATAGRVEGLGFKWSYERTE